ncbi:hypothetical protein ABZ766_29665 [Streptomyces sp. NPDC006670]|uniref:hypothetical protein n=1 Tax=Streptomyces sp. NPDC006670 TaxID=3154476 RepID=UPI0033FF2365
MTHVSSAGGPLRLIVTLFVTAALTLSFAVTLTLASSHHASASCAANSYTGQWRSTDGRLKRIDVRPGGDDCQLYATAWSTCQNDASRICSWGARQLQGSPDPNFRFFSYQWNNASEVIQLHLQDGSHLRAWDSTDYNSGSRDSFWVSMTKSS